MDLSHLKNPTLKEWAYFIFAVVVWSWFTLHMPCEVGYPWNVLVKFLGAICPYFWVKFLNIDIRNGSEEENGPPDPPRTLTRTGAIRLVYLVLGALAWGTFVVTIPADVFSRFPHGSVLRDILGFLAPFPLLACLMIAPDYFHLRSSRVDNGSGNARKHPFYGSGLPLILTLFSILLWVLFVGMIPADPHHYSGGATLSSLVNFNALWTLVFAVPWTLSVRRKKDRVTRTSKAEHQEVQ